MSFPIRWNLIKPDIGTAGAGHPWGVYATGAFDPISLIHGVLFHNDSFNVVRTSFALFHGVVSQAGVRPVKTPAFGGNQQWKPSVLQPFALVTNAGNRQPGSRLGGCEPEVRTYRANYRCELAAVTHLRARSDGAYQCRTTLSPRRFHALQDA